MAYLTWYGIWRVYCNFEFVARSYSMLHAVVIFERLRKLAMLKGARISSPPLRVLYKGVWGRGVCWVD